MKTYGQIRKEELPMALNKIRAIYISCHDEHSNFDVGHYVCIEGDLHKVSVLGSVYSEATPLESILKLIDDYEDAGYDVIIRTLLVVNNNA